MEQDDKQAQEIWETTTGGTTYVHVKDPRNPNGWVQKKVGGKGSKRITITVEEREFNQELVTYENQHLDPFTNGLLYRVSPKTGERSQYEISDEELVALLKGGEDEDFEETITKTASEVILRRMLFLAERNATMHRYNFLKDAIDSRFQIGKTSRVVEEMMNDDAKYAGADL
jgi:hypothetical protein